jgi:hypothetical protein
MNSVPIPTRKLHRKFNTPQLLRSGWYLTWGINLLLLIVSIWGVNSQRKAIETVGKDSAPSILTAQQLQDSFADLDASLANELLLKPGEERQVLADFDKNRKKIADRLVAAAKNITYPEEEVIIQKLQLNIGAYLLKLQETRDAHKRGDAIGTLNLYQSAASLMDANIIPQAAALNDVNYQQLKISYENQGVSNGLITLLIALLGLVQIGILVMIQIFLARRMRRILNLPLLGATAIAVVWLGYTLSAFGGATADLKTAKEDAFDSLHSLRKMRSVSYKANGDESRYLLDRTNSARHQKSFNEKVASIVMLPPNQSIDSIIANTKQGKSTPGLTGFFADELNNITFAGERELAIETLSAFNDYLAIDKKIRQLYQSGKVAEAISLCIGNKQGESNWAFDRYKDLHTKLMDLNKAEFDRNIEVGNHRLADFEVIAAVALGSIAIFTLVGLRPRLIEYL